MRFIGLLFKRHPVHTVLVLLAALVTTAFVIRFVSDVIYWQWHEREPIRPWMTVGYIGKSYDISPRLIDKTAGLPLPDPHPYTIERIARERGVPEAEIITLIENAIAEIEGNTTGGRQGE